MMKIENAPGLVWRQRKGYLVAFWQCRTDIRKLGYRPTAFPLWRGTELELEDRELIADQCRRLQADMLAFAYGELKEKRVIKPIYDGTVSSLIFCYRNDEDSGYHKTRYNTRRYYNSLCKRIVEDYGHMTVAELRGRHMLRWHEGWTSHGRAMAHSLMRMMRIALGFGMSILECNECARMVAVLGAQRFPSTPARSSILTADMANAIREEAHRQGLHSIAIAQAFQFDGMLRQKDVIGEWVPEREPGPAIITHEGKKWARGIVWTEIDGNLILRHITSKRQKEIELRLADAPMVMEELKRLGELPTFGPIVLSDRTGRPWHANDFRKAWRKIADKVGVPRGIKNMDARAGAITEATDAGAELEHIKHAATHSDIAMTQRYARGGMEKAAKVLQMRVAHRNRTDGKRS